MTDIWETTATYTSAQIAEQTNADLPLVIEVLSKAVGKEFEVQLGRLKELVEVLVPEIEKELDGLNAPWTPGRMPKWDK